MATPQGTLKFPDIYASNVTSSAQTAVEVSCLTVRRNIVEKILAKISEKRFTT